MTSSKTNDVTAENDAVADQSQQDLTARHCHDRSSSGYESPEVAAPDSTHPQTPASSPTDGRNINNSNVLGASLSPIMTSTVLASPAPVLELPALTPATIEPPPYKPGTIEANGYYCGLPSRPLLVARSSGESWRRMSPSYPMFSRTKALGIVGEHPIRDAWDAKFQAEIIEALGATRWTSIDIVRIGYAGLGESKAPHPVVLWIGVRAGSLTWDEGITIVEACVAILRRRNLIDVHCEIRESEVHASVRPPTRYLSFESLPSELDSYRLPFTASPGQSINTVGSGFHGTLGLYLKPGENNPYQGSVWAVSCRHVVCPTKDREEKYQYKHTSQPRINVLLPSDDAFEKATKNAKCMMEMNSDTVAYLEKQLALGTLEQTQELDEARKDLTESRDLVENTLSKWQSPMDRIFGYVRIAPPIQTALSMNPSLDLFGPRRDWALIEVNKDKHPGPVANSVDVVTDVAPGVHSYTQMLLSHFAIYSRTPPVNRLVDKKLLRLGRVVPIDELRTPKMRNPHEDPCLIVGKRGAVSDVTWGFLNGIKSILWHDDNTRSMEGCVVPTAKNSAFSCKGDSGSAVFDLTGRVVGIIVGGAEGLCGRDSMDITYVTPMAWLQKDMKDFGYGVEIA